MSVGGNDALGFAHLLGAPAGSVAQALTLLADAQDRFAADYAAMLDGVLAVGLPAAVCTVYDTHPSAPDHRVVRAALALFNDHITRAAFRRAVPLVDLRLVCTDAADYANPIEPSVARRREDRPRRRGARRPGRRRPAVPRRRRAPRRLPGAADLSTTCSQPAELAPCREIAPSTVRSRVGRADRRAGRAGNPAPDPGRGRRRRSATTVVGRLACRRDQGGGRHGRRTHAAGPAHRHPADERPGPRGAVLPARAPRRGRGAASSTCTPGPARSGSRPRAAAATAVTLVDSARAAADVCRRNVATLGLTGVDVVAQRAERFVASPAGGGLGPRARRPAVRARRGRPRRRPGRGRRRRSPRTPSSSSSARRGRPSPRGRRASSAPTGARTARPSCGSRPRAA